MKMSFQFMRVLTTPACIAGPQTGLLYIPINRSCLNQTANDRLRTSNRFFYLAAAVYAYNWVDVLWMDNGGVSFKKSPSRSLDLGLRVSNEGDAILQLSSRF